MRRGVRVNGRPRSTAASKSLSKCACVSECSFFLVLVVVVVVVVVAGRNRWPIIRNHLRRNAAGKPNAPRPPLKDENKKKLNIKKTTTECRSKYSPVVSVDRNQRLIFHRWADLLSDSFFSFFFLIQFF